MFTQAPEKVKVVEDKRSPNMKMLATGTMQAEDKDKGCKVKIKAPTNAIRFKLVELYNTADDAEADVIAIATLLFSKVLITAEIDGNTYDGTSLQRADLSDEETAEKFFVCMNLVSNMVFGVSDDDETKK